jgi:hypothetical protein
LIDVEIGYQRVVDILGEVEADQVRLLQRPEHAKPRAEALLDDIVDRFRVADAGRHQRDRFALERVLQPVADEAWNVAMDEYRMTADRPQDGGQPIGRRTIGIAHQHNLHQRHEMRRIPEMRAEHAVFML